MRLIGGLLLAMAGAQTMAWECPWADNTEQRPEYCRGFVLGGLDSQKVVGSDRTELWLAYNYQVRTQGVLYSDTEQEYWAGRNQFPADLSPDAARALVTETEGQCGLGRSGHQVTGW
ncbi:MAG: hypothetical protein AAGA91_15690 [Pseudomonadota bacterium]